MTTVNNENSLILRAKKVSKSFRQGELTIPVLSDLDLQLKKRETLAILGESGSGKSTLLSLLAGLDSPSSGNIEVDGQNISVMDEDKLARFRARRIGIVFQQYHLLSHLTALENISLSLEISRDPDATKKAESALEKVGLAHRRTHFPHQMSGGEAQRVAIARALIVEPSILLLDEPSGNLDTATGRKVMDLMFGLVESLHMTSVLVTHSEDLAKQCARRLNLVKGRLSS